MGTAERELKASNQQALKKAKEKLRSLEGSSDASSSEVAALKKQLKDTERKFSSQLASKEEEIQRVSRRNEVLSEAVSRLTQMNSVGGTPSAANGEGGYGFTNKGGYMSYDQHQQSMETSSSRLPSGSEYYESQRLSPISGGSAHAQQVVCEMRKLAHPVVFSTDCRLWTASCC